MKKQNSRQVKSLRIRTETLRVLGESSLTLAAGGSVVSSDSNGAGHACPTIEAFCQQY